MLFYHLANKNTWRAKRKEYLQCARACRSTLISKRGLSADDEVVKTAIRWWVKRAKRTHAIVMQREPVIEQVLCAEVVCRN